MKRNRKGQFVKNPRRRRNARAVNPRRRKRRHNPAMVNPRRRRRHARAANPRRRKRRHNPVGYVTRGQKRRRRRSYARRHNPRRRRNPRFNVGGILKHVTNSAMPAAAGAVGMLGVDIALGYVSSYLPAMLTTGMAKQAVRAVVGPIAVGFIASKVLGAERGSKAAVGAMSVALYDLAKSLATQFAPSLTTSLGEFPEYSMMANDPASVLSGMGAYMAPAMPAPQMGAYMEPSMGAYLDDSLNL